MEMQQVEEQKNDTTSRPSIDISEYRQTNDGIEFIQDSVLINLVRCQRWNDVKSMLAEDHRMANETDTIICSDLLRKLLLCLERTRSEKTIDIKQFQDLLVNIFPSLSEDDDTINYLRDELFGVNKEHIEHHKLLNHDKLPRILLTIYYHHQIRQSNSGNDSKTIQQALKQIFAESEDSEQKVENEKEVLFRINTDAASNEHREIQSKFGKVIQRENKLKIEMSETKSGKLQMDSAQYQELINTGRTKLIYGKDTEVTANKRTKAWLSCDLRLDDIKNREQYFVISGWINVIWKEPKYSDLYEAIMNCYHNEVNSKNVWHFGDKIFMRILDLRDADRISYYLPIDARRIFDQLSVKYVNHRHPPYLLFNKRTGIIRTEYNITAALSEHFELFWFPFDKQFLNIKIRWNIDFYSILHWKSGKDENGIPKIPNIPKSVRYRDTYYTNPLKLNVVEELQDDIIMHEPWIGTKDKLEQRKGGLRFALIRLRFTRNPVYHAIYLQFPFFLIVLSGFSVYSIPIEDIGDRLGVTLTVLLTFTAFQSILSEELPHTADLSFMDYYTLFAYFLQGVIVFSVAYPYFMNRKIDDIEIENDTIFAFILLALWLFISICYIFGGILIWSSYKCCSRNNKEFWFYSKFWENRARQEIKKWTSDRMVKQKFVMRVPDLIHHDNGDDDNNHSPSGEAVTDDDQSTTQNLLVQTSSKLTV